MYDDEKTDPGEAKEPTRPAPVLLVDDDPASVEFLRSVLEEAGYAVTTAADGRQGLELLLSMKPEPFVVLLDLVMPVMDGWQLIAIMRSYRRLGLIPVIAVTAIEVLPQAREVFEAFVPKPVTPSALLAAVARIAERHGGT